MFDLQHYQAGGVIDANISASGNILSVSGEGSLALFLRQDPFDVSSEPDKAALAALQKLPEIQVLSDFDAFVAEDYVDPGDREARRVELE